LKESGSAGLFAVGFPLPPSRSQPTVGRTDRRRILQDNDGNKRQTVEIQVTHVGPDLQFAIAEVAKSTAEGGWVSSSDGPSAASSAEEKQSA
jgi:hypothetical protein